MCLISHLSRLNKIGSYACVSLAFASSASLFAASSSYADERVPLEVKPAVLELASSVEQSAGQLASIRAHTEDEMISLLDRASELLNSGQYFPQNAGIVFLLHGPEVDYFRKSNFNQYRSLVEKAAQLDALNVIDVQVCELYLRNNDIDRAQLPAFVETVANGPKKEKELLEKGYRHF